MKNRKHPFNKYEVLHEDYASKNRDYNLSVPANFRMLCAITETRPEKILHDFMWNVSYMMTKASDEQRKAAAEYFILCGYGQDMYPEQDIRQIFRELDAKRCLWPDRDDQAINDEQRDLHYTWGHMYMQCWFKKWFWKVRRKGKLSVLREY